MYQVNIWGKASNKLICSKKVSNDEVNENALVWLRNQNIPIASSCNGDGVCKKCVINNNVLSCKTTLNDLVTSADQILIEVSYL
jgi:Na+-transporting NADH:ubiquinone oxidoreductase subunit NqrF